MLAKDSWTIALNPKTIVVLEQNIQAHTVRVRVHCNTHAYAHVHTHIKHTCATHIPTHIQTAPNVYA